MLHTLQWKSYVHTCTQPVIKKFYSLKNILACCGYSLTFPFFLLLSEHKHCDNVATNSKSENARSRMVASLWGSVGTGTKNMGQVLGAFGLLDFTMLWPFLAWHAFWNLWTVNFFNFPIFFQATVNHRYGCPPIYKILLIYIHCTFVGLNKKQKYFAHNHMLLSLCLWIT